MSMPVSAGWPQADCRETARAVLRGDGRLAFQRAFRLDIFDRRVYGMIGRRVA